MQGTCVEVEQKTRLGLQAIVLDPDMDNEPI
jgi:hypothetical protein